MDKKSQLFKHKEDKNVLKKITLEFMKLNFKYDTLRKEYYIDESLYKHMYQIGIINTFRNNISPFYYDSKQNYPLYMSRYKGMITVLRQLSRYLDISYRYDITYFHSKYNIKYYFDLDNNLDNELSISNTS